MTPILPYSVWMHLRYGTITVTCSEVAEDKSWIVTLIDRKGKTHHIKTNQDEWIAETSFICELDELINPE